MSPQHLEADRPILRLDEHELRCIATDGGIKLLEQLDGGVGLISTWADLDRGRASLLARGLLTMVESGASLTPLKGIQPLFRDLARPDVVLLAVARDPYPSVRLVLACEGRAYLLASAEDSSVSTHSSAPQTPSGAHSKDPHESGAGAPTDDGPLLLVDITPVPDKVILEAALGKLVSRVNVPGTAPAMGAELVMSVTVWGAILDAVAAGSIEDASLHVRSSGATAVEADMLVKALSSGMSAGGLTAQRHLSDRVIQDDLGWIRTADWSRWWLVESRTPGAMTMTPTSAPGLLARAHALLEELG